MPDGGEVCRVIGIGNPDRGDDGVGRMVARRLKGLLPDGIDVVEHDGEAAGLLDCLEGAGTTYLIDACLSGGRPGEIHRFDVAAAPLPAGRFGLSSHGLGLAEAVELARALGKLPPRCIVYAIEGEGFDPGAPLSDAAAKAGARLCDQLAAALTGSSSGSTC